MMRCTILVACALIARADILQSTFGNTALAGPATATTVPCINITTALPDYVSLRFDGTIAAPVTEFINFTVQTDGIVRVWVDDHLLIEDLSVNVVRSIAGFFAIPFNASGSPLPLRLEYTHYTGPTLIQLRWAGNVTSDAIVPPSALTDFIPPAAQQRQALRDRLYTPTLPWQTYFNPSMCSHAHMPSGVALVMTLADAGNTSVNLGDVFVYRQNKPARVRVGPHSYSGDVTELTIDRWEGRDCSVLMQSSMIGVDLVYLVTSTGVDCSGVQLLVTPQMLWNRAGNISFTSARNDSVAAVMPGFPTITLYAVTPTTKDVNCTGLCMALPLAAPGQSSGVAALSSGSNYTLAAISTAIATARAAQMAHIASYGNLSLVYEAMQSIIAWNSMYHPDEGVVTPVSRGWDFGHGYVIFDWDNLFLAYMAAFEDGVARDLGYANAIQIILARTLDGLVPNYASGLRKSYDRTEPQIGAFVIREMYNKYKDAWLVETVFDALLAWNNWVWRRRRGEGSLAPPGDVASLIVLGTDPTDPMGDWSTNQMQGARYESGLDNSPMYDGNDTRPVGPVEFDNVTHHMMLYDVGMTALYLSDTAALIDLAPITGRSDVIPQLQVQLAAVQAAMNKYMWDGAAGIYSNVLYNGSFYSRYAPTSFFPLMSNSSTDAQADALATWLASPEGFCVNATDPGAAGTLLLFQWFNSDWNDNCACGTDACTISSVENAYTVIEPEMRVLETPPPGVPALPLNLYLDDSGHDLALTTGATAPGGYSLIRNEGFCYVEANADVGLVNVTLWYSTDRNDYKTCATAACLQDVNNMKYNFITHLCYTYDASAPSSWGCKYGVPSIARSDAAFGDNTYWRGRIWGPHVQLVYWGLRAYDHVPSVRAVRQVMVAQGKALVEQEWTWFRHVNENMNGWLGVGSDVSDADPFYHWGALPGFISFLEAGMY